VLFKDALRQFQDSGVFKLQQTPFFFSELNQLRKVLLSHPDFLRKPAQLHLRQVKLIPRSALELEPHKNWVFTDRTAKEELPLSYKPDNLNLCCRPRTRSFSCSVI
jgi:hypothetical protein